jgi:hypothetical protein
VRLNAGSATKEKAVNAGRTLAELALASDWKKSGPIHV